MHRYSTGTIRSFELYDAMDKIDANEKACLKGYPLDDYSRQIVCYDASVESSTDLVEWQKIKEHPPICQYPIRHLKITCEK